MTNVAVEAANAQPAAPQDPVVAMIPRINIAVFCEDNTTSQAMQAVISDRRMARAHMTVQMGGIAGAVQAYGQSKTPEVLIIETMKAREGVMGDLGHLANVCDPSTKVIVIGHVNDVLLYRELKSQGVSEYVVAPVHQLQIIESISTLFSDPEAKPIGRITSFIGAKGGSGSSFIAQNVAWLLSNQYKTDTVITDFDLAFGTTTLNLNQEVGQGMAEALVSSDRMDQVLFERLLTKCDDRLSMLASPGSIDREIQIEPDAVDTVMEMVRANVPNVIVDIPNIWAPWSKRILVQSDEVVIVAVPDLASLRNAKALVDFLTAARKNDGPPKLVVNQVGLVKRPEIPVAEFAKALGVQPTVVVPFDAQGFGVASNNGEMLLEAAPKSPATEQVIRLTQILSGREAPEEKQGFSLSSLLPMITKREK